MTIEENAAKYGRTIEEEKARVKAQRLERNSARNFVPQFHFNEEIRTVAREYCFDSETLQILLQAVGKELSKSQCKRILRYDTAKEQAYYALQDTYTAFCAGMSRWKAHDGTKEEFEEDYLKSVVFRLSQRILS